MRTADFLAAASILGLPGAGNSGEAADWDPDDDDDVVMASLLLMLLLLELLMLPTAAAAARLLLLRLSQASRPANTNNVAGSCLLSAVLSLSSKTFLMDDTGEERPFVTPRVIVNSQEESGRMLAAGPAISTACHRDLYVSAVILLL